MNQSTQSPAFQSGPGYTSATNCFDQHLQVLARDTISSTPLKHGLCDRKGACVMNAVLWQLHSPIVRDIDANIGNHSLAMSTVAKKIYSFETQSSIYQALTVYKIATRIPATLHRHQL